MGICHVGDDGRSMLVETHNVLGATVGDKVRLASRAGQFLLGLLGAFFSLRIDPNLLAAILGVTFMVGSFFIIRIGSRAIPHGTFMPEIIEILPGEECSEEQHGY